jgi:hypothetical protein
MRNGFGCWVSTVVVMVVCIASVRAEEDAKTSAADVLNAAQNARAIWEDFPGFEANLVVRHDNQVGKGKIVVDDYGEVSLTEFGDFDTKPIMSQVGALIMHRMPGESFAPNAQFAEEGGSTHWAG